MVHKGFGTNLQPKLLIKKWLIPENRQYYRFKSNSFVLESLPMTLNMWLAMAANRFNLKSGDVITNQESALALIVELDTELMQNTLKGGRWFIKIKTDDSYYVGYYNHLLNLVKVAVNQGNYSSLNGCIQNTWEYKEWMRSCGHLLVTQKLIDNWIHPLSEVSTIDGKEVVNAWMFASLACGAATGRCDEGNRETCITRLIQLGALNIEANYQTRLKVCQAFDSEYLKLVSETKNAFDIKTDKAFEDKK